MNQKDLKKAITAYKGVFETEGAEAVKAQMAEGDFSEADIEQVLEALKPAEKKLDKAKTGYEKWLCGVKDGKAEKLKLIKTGVQISDEEAETLNAGRLTGGNVGNVEMFFKPE
jgi:hypothetical protein